jgi:hypothetical protein
MTLHYVIDGPAWHSQWPIAAVQSRCFKRNRTHPVFTLHLSGTAIAKVASIAADGSYQRAVLGLLFNMTAA